MLNVAVCLMLRIMSLMRNDAVSILGLKQAKRAKNSTPGTL